TRVAHEGEEGLFGVELRVSGGRITLLRLPPRLPGSGGRVAGAGGARLGPAVGPAGGEGPANNQPGQVGAAGLPVLLVPVSTFEALEEALPRYDELRSILRDFQEDATLVYAFTKETRNAQSAAHARAFDVVGSVEVAAAGAAAGALAAYLVSEA